ncbi:hypothetical protein MKEN_01490600 [Mycena kentingensis (nom. inval.)]|nr:hypothetical protein MKEN_01490600 [Mycena kentingensis (nom. inval.)]
MLPLSTLLGLCTLHNLIGDYTRNAEENKGASQTLRSRLTATALCKIMGIRKLWEVVSPAGQTTTLSQLATERGFQTDNRGVRSWIVGVDMGTRLSALQKLSFRNWWSSEKRILELFFYQLCNLQHCSATFVFVFDGPGRPQIKRGVHVRSHSRKLLKNVKQLIRAFGYYVHNAPGEAEAELAYLNKSANIDAIITTDSDAFVFGGICVLQMNGSKVFEEISVYEATNLASSVGLDAVGFLLVALMAGGDYDDAWVRDAPCRDIQQLPRRCTYTAARYLAQVCAVRMETNPSGRLECAHPEVARKITRSFPDSSIVDLYRRPMTSQSSSSPIPRWIPVQPELATISKLATLLLGWKGSTKAEKFHRVLWPGVAFRLVSSRYVLYNNVHRRLVTPSCSTTLVKLQRKRGSQTELTIRVSVEDFCAQSNVAALESSALLHIPETVLAVATRDVEAMTTSFSIRPDVVQAIRNATNSSRLLDPPVVVEPNAAGS